MSFWNKLFGDSKAHPLGQQASVEVTSDRLLVSNLSFNATEIDICKLFNGSGVVKNAEVVLDKLTHRSKGFAFVTMMSIEDAKKAVADLHNKEFMGRPLAISGVKPPVAPVAPQQSSPPQKTVVAEPPLQIRAADFANHAAKGPAWSRLPIRNIPQIVTELNAQMERLNVSSDALHDLYNNSLLGVCPKCNEYCAGKAFLRMPLLAAVGDKVSFTGNSGGFERMLEGTCLNYSCASTEFDLFWCPDLDSRMLQNLRERGINLDPNIQRKRDHVWRPQ